ncbi:MAG TPA: macro domain-containing protein [Tepidisphaeraceae bacterium]|nr:macro domain-containing protein [Tepidisphaeraceae bacterium]
MLWTITHGDILDLPADVLVCSANVFLNLSGGVGGAILLRIGTAMQQELHRYLANTQKKYVERGEVVETAPHGLPFKTVLHAVAVDGFYRTSPEVVRAVVDKCLARAAALGAKTVSLTALATGYGRLSMAGFAQAIEPLQKVEYPPLEQIRIRVRNSGDEADLRAAMAEHSA